MESPIQPHEAQTIYIQFIGRHIRKWSLKPFEGGIRFDIARVKSKPDQNIERWET